MSMIGILASGEVLLDASVNSDKQKERVRAFTRLACGQKRKTAPFDAAHTGVIKDDLHNNPYITCVFIIFICCLLSK